MMAWTPFPPNHCLYAARSEDYILLDGEEFAHLLRGEDAEEAEPLETETIPFYESSEE